MKSMETEEDKPCGNSYRAYQRKHESCCDLSNIERWILFKQHFLTGNIWTSNKDLFDENQARHCEKLVFTKKYRELLSEDYCKTYLDSL